MGGIGLRIDLALAPIPRAGDATANAFTFNDVLGVIVSTVQTSNTITVSGLSEAVRVPVSVSGGTMSKNGDGFTAASDMAQNGDTFAVRHTSSASAATAVNTTLLIGGVGDTFTSTTA